MDKNNMKYNIRESLNERTPDVLDNIKSSSQFKVPLKEKKSFSNYFSFSKIGYSLATVFVLAIIVTAVFTGTNTTPVIASTITVDINPSIEITLDENDFVINVTAINDDGNEIINRDIKFRGLTLDSCLEILIEEAYNKGFIVDTTDENVILISVESGNQQVKSRIEAQLETLIENEVNKYAAVVRVIRANDNDLTPGEIANLAEIAQVNRITVAKLMLINKIIILDDTYTLIDLKDMTVKELYRLEYQLSNPEVEEEDYPWSPGNNNPGQGN